MNHELRAHLTIEWLNARGEGVARYHDRLIDIPYALVGEEIIAEVEGTRGIIGEILTPSPLRMAAFCTAFTRCGGCMVQHLSPPAYAAWKHEQFCRVMQKAGITTDIDAVLDAHGEGRRRVTLHARYVQGLGPQRIEVGFMKARAHDIVSIEHCPLLSPALKNAVPIAHALAHALRGLAKPLDLQITESDDGLDVDIRGCGALDDAARRNILAVTHDHDLARVSNHGVIIIERRTPHVRMGEAMVRLPAGGFLQATKKGEEILAELVMAPLSKAKRIVDLFAGIGTFTLRLAAGREVLAIETDGPALAALKRAAHSTPALRQVKTEQRDLFARPMRAQELSGIDGLVFDPPRAGAEAQARELAGSTVPIIIAVSCNVQSLARDAGLLIAGGYSCEKITPVDQFRHSPHIEAVAVFRKTPPRKRGRLLG